MSFDKFKFEFCTAAEIDSRFQSIIKDCTGKEDHGEIKKIIQATLGNTILPITLLEPGYEFQVYRVTQEYSGFKEADAECYSHPPVDLVERNRANIQRHPVLYTSFNIATALREAIPRINVDESFFVSEWTIKITQKTNLFTLVINSKTIEGKFLTSPLVKSLLDKLHRFFENYPNYDKEGFQQLLIKYGDMFSSPGKDLYNISSSIAHGALYEARQQRAIIPILMYPSIISGYHMLNFAFHPEFVKSQDMKLTKVVEYQIDEIQNDGIKGRYKRRGLNIDGQIKWLNYKSELEEVFLDDDVKAVIEGKTVFEGEKALSLKIADTNSTLKDKLGNLFYHGIKGTCHVFYPTTDAKDMFDYSAIREQMYSVLDLNKNAIQVIVGGKKRSITRLIARVQWKGTAFLDPEDGGIIRGHDLDEKK